MKNFALNANFIRQSAFVIISVVLLFPVQQLNAQSLGKMTDKRDGKTYETVKMGEKVWIAQNLNYESPDSWCYADKPEYCAEYGRLYTWKAAMNACPARWSLPTDADWVALEKVNGGVEKAGANLMRGGSSGFNATLGGIRCTDGVFVNQGAYGDYWTSTTDVVGNAYMRYFFVQHKKLYRISFHKDTGRSVRCVKD
ncbi:MAG: FISUMP domain-containing protein [Chitinophagales bacterium]|nr:FISUMP domain-containing protein [Chitinophagales bacterium]